MTGSPPRNWAGNIEYRAERLLHPASLEELRAVVAAARRVRALGTGHSFNRIADTTGTLVRLDALGSAIEIDQTHSTVRVPAGARYADIVGQLHTAGYALANLASLPHISIAGSLATGTHGSGDTLRGLADAVVGVRLVNASGDLVWLPRGHPDFDGAVVSLGALGIVTDLTLRVEPTFTVAQEVRVGVPLDEIGSRWDEVFGAAYSVSAFTTYTDGLANVFLKRRPGHDGTGWSGGRAAEAPVHPIPGGDTAACTTQLGVPGPWHERLPHFRPDLVPSAGDELQSEFFVPRQVAPEALEALRGIGDQLAKVLLTCEMRTIRGDQLWLSPAYGRDTVAFHFTWILDVPAVQRVVALVEKALLPLGARPHWGKISTVDPAEIVARYPRAADFAALRQRYDPESTFVNAYTAALFG